MNPCRVKCLVILLCVLGSGSLLAAENGKTGPKQPGAASPGWSAPDPEFLELVRRTQDLAEQSQAELKRIREQDESVRKDLEETRRELARLSQEVSQLRSRVASLQSNGQPGNGAAKVRAVQGKSLQSDKSETAGEALRGRVEHIEDQVKINAAQIKEQAQTKVESDSRYSVRLFGTILDNMYYNTSDRSDVAVPTAAPPGSAADRNSGNLGATLRQTQFGFAMTGPKFGGARLSADVNFDFYGGSGSVYSSNALGVLRMRTASARLEGPRTSLSAGLMPPMVSPLNPTSLASVYYPALGESGNLWQWRPQLILGRRTQIYRGDDLVLQAGLTMPFGDTISGRQLAGRPGYETRIAFSRKLDTERQLEIGFGGYFHPQPFGFARTIDSYAATGDWLVPLGSRLELSGEAFFGRSIGLSKQSGGNLSDVFAFSGPLDDPATTVRGIHSFGGWTQLHASATPRLEFNLAFGLDDPRNRDVFSGLFDDTSRLKNQTISINSIYRFRSNFLGALEYRRMWTTYPDGRNGSGQINIALGYLF